ncbi:hypothetical protein [Clostridium sp. CF012]|nr:hypothetical protein [Clostridium sp. CF012]MBU3144710.1 hypothetical protein [Clostridium sp. CF012]
MDSGPAESNLIIEFKKFYIITIANRYSGMISLLINEVYLDYYVMC